MNGFDQALRRMLSIATVSGLLLLPGRAFAGDPAAAEVLFTEARALVMRGDYEHACPKLEESQRLDAGMGTLFNLADCYEHVGKVASAWAAFREVASSAKAAGQAAREADARARAAALEPKLVTIAVEVSAAAAALPSLVVKRDATALGRPQWGSAIPIDPGKHVVSVTADGKQTWQTEVTVTDATRSTKVVVPALEDAAAKTPGTDSSVAGAPRTSSAGSTQRTVGLVLGGAGLVAVGLGSFFGLRSMSVHDDGQAHCDQNSVCDSQGFALRNDARDAGNISTGAFIAGAVLLTGGAALYFTAPRASAPTGNAAAVGFGPGAVTFKGSF